MAGKDTYCCEVFVDTRGLPIQFVTELFPKPAEDLQTFEAERTILSMELRLLGACEHYRNQSTNIHRDRCDYLMNADIRFADYLGIPLSEYEAILTNPNT